MRENSIVKEVRSTREEVARRGSLRSKGRMFRPERLVADVERGWRYKDDQDSQLFYYEVPGRGDAVAVTFTEWRQGSLCRVVALAHEQVYHLLSPEELRGILASLGINVAANLTIREKKDGRFSDPIYFVQPLYVSKKVRVS